MLPPPPSDVNQLLVMEQPGERDNTALALVRSNQMTAMRGQGSDAEDIFKIVHFSRKRIFNMKKTMGKELDSLFLSLPLSLSPCLNI